MKITEASESDIREMVNRINRRQSDRKAQKDMEEVVRMVQKTPFVKAPIEKTVNDDTYFFNGMKLITLSFVGAIFWNITEFKTFLAFVVVTIVMAVIEFYRCFTNGIR